MEKCIMQKGADDCTKITRIDALKDALDIDFDNDSTLILCIDLILGLPGFGTLAEDDRIYYPKTDGNSIYWRDGPRSLSVAEILSLAGRPGSRDAPKSSPD
jgi:hypothetical protein